MRLVTVVGARPQFVKAAAVCRALAEFGGTENVLIHTGQHFDDEMSRVFFEELRIPEPDHHLGIHGGSHGAMTGRMLAAVEPELMKLRPDMVVVFGDTNSTLAGALAAAKLRIPVGHVEAGLRSFNRAMPEEVNRVLTDHVSDLLLCPTRTAVTNLEREGIRRAVHHVGDVMYDSALFMAQLPAPETAPAERLGLAGTEYAVATVHRAENTEDRRSLSRVLDYLHACARERPVVLVMHPRLRAALADTGLEARGLRLVPPLGYRDMAHLMRSAAVVYTDSGGLQKEAYFHRVPCVTLRGETEWPETVEAGWNRLWSEPAWNERRCIDEYGDGHAAMRCVELIAQAVQGGEPG